MLKLTAHTAIEIGNATFAHKKYIVDVSIAALQVKVYVDVILPYFLCLHFIFFRVVMNYDFTLSAK